MGINLENPKTFLPLLLFIGFVFSLIGLGLWTWTSNAGLVIVGYLTMMLAVFLWVLINRRRF
ncbi:MAG: hypothetical protein ABSD73_09460 [Candidatus Bathyarchaeia archaeon]